VSLFPIDSVKLFKEGEFQGLPYGRCLLPINTNLDC